ncbi:MAG: cation:proton antiporter regulatory subunit [Acidimicrobiales bacterium]|nr:cation:proton antiporter regulatory subunit [Acidimicrobiales bacterium]
MTQIHETKLPGVGTLHDFECQSGDRVGVISHHGDRREIVIYDPNDPDRVSESAAMTADEARVFADLLGGTTVTERLDNLRQEIDGLAIDWLPISPHSPYAGTTIGETALRSRTGVSIVALVRGRRPLPAPGPEQALMADDTAVVVGTVEGITAAAKLLSRRPR